MSMSPEDIRSEASDRMSEYINEKEDRDDMTSRCVTDVMNGVTVFDQPHHKHVKFFVATTVEMNAAIAGERDPVWPSHE